MSYIGDFAADQTFDVKFCTVTTTGAPTTLAGTPVVSAYIDNSTTQITAGITLTVDFDAVTGLNNVRVVATTANGYTSGSNVQLVITTGTVGGTSVVGYVIGQFSINARSALRPTTTGRTLAVDASNKAPATIAAGDIANNAITAAAIADAAIDRASFAADTGLQSIRSNTAQTGGASTITLDAGASAVDDFYNGGSILTTGGTGVGQFRIIIDYVGATKVATVDAAWATNPDATTTFAIFPAADTAADIADAVWDEARAGHVTAGSFGEGVASVQGSVTGSVASVTATVSANAVQISGDTAAADNAEAFFDGTGYAGTNNVIPSVTTVTGNVNGNVGGNVTGSIGSLAAQAKTDVNTEVLDVLVTDTFAEPAAVPAATASLKDKIGWQAVLARNKITQTATTQLVRNDADNATIGTSTVSDDGTTATRGEFA